MLSGGKLILSRIIQIELGSNGFDQNGCRIRPSLKPDAEIVPDGKQIVEPVQWSLLSR